MKVYLTTDERKKLMKRGPKSASYIQVAKIVESMGITPEMLDNDRMKFMVNAEIKRRFKVAHQRGTESIVYQVAEVSPDLLFNMQEFFDTENIGANITLVDYGGTWRQHHDLFLNVITS